MRSHSWNRSPTTPWPRPARSSRCISTTPAGPPSAAVRRSSRPTSSSHRPPWRRFGIGTVNVERPAGCELLGFEGEIALIIGKPARRVGTRGRLEPRRVGHRQQRPRRLRPPLRGQGLQPPVQGRRRLHARGPGPDRRGRRRPRQHCGSAPGTTANWSRTTPPQDLLFPFARLVADLSQLLTLEEGDIILTGTPAGASVAKPGDVVEVEVDAPAAGPDHRPAGHPGGGRHDAVRGLRRPAQDG